MATRRETASESPHLNFIIRTLEERIRTGEYAASRWLPPERALCAEFDVSRAMLRLALVALEQRHLLLRAAGCRPMVQAVVHTVPARRDCSRGNIGLCLKQDAKYSGTYLITQGVQQVADTDALRLIIGGVRAATMPRVAETEARTLGRMIEDEDIAGIILWFSGLEVNLGALQAVRAASIPIVFVDRRPPEGFEADYIGIDNERAAREAMQYLLAKGHRTIAHITNPEPVSAVHDRMTGYREALQSAGLPVREDLILTGQVEGLAEAGQSPGEIVEHLLGLPTPPTAVFAVTDYIALAIVRALNECGKRVPEDMAVVGFDDLEQWFPQKPFLTTVRQPFERIGFEAARLLIKRLENRPINHSRHVMLDTSLIVRDSA